MQLSFFNTINLKDLTEVNETCSLQEERVLRIIRGPMTPFEVLEIYNKMYDPIPITSLRRAMTVLTGKGKLEKTDEMREGNYGKKNFTWRKV